MTVFPHQPIPPNPKARFEDPKTGYLSQYGLQFLQQIWSLVANTNPITPCTATHTGNVYALTPFPSKATPFATPGQINSYVDYSVFTFVSPFTSTGLVTASVAPFAPKNVYKNNGSAQATTGDIQSNDLYLLIFNSNLNSGAGGFVLK